MNNERRLTGGTEQLSGCKAKESMYIIVCNIYVRETPTYLRCSITYRTAEAVGDSIGVGGATSGGGGVTLGGGGAVGRADVRGVPLTTPAPSV